VLEPVPDVPVPVVFVPIVLSVVPLPDVPVPVLDAPEFDVPIAPVVAPLVPEVVPLVPDVPCVWSRELVPLCVPLWVCEPWSAPVVVGCASAPGANAAQARPHINVPERIPKRLIV